MKKKIIILSIILFVLVITIANVFLINPTQLNVRFETINTSLIKENATNFTIGFFADTHYDKDQGKQFKKAIKALKDYNPDVILFGGDLVDNYSHITNADKEDIINELKSLDTKSYKYAVLGNHDLKYSEAENLVKEMLIESGFIILEDETVHVYLNENDFINLVGLDCQIYKDIDINEAYSNVTNNHFTLTFMHEPDSYDLLPLDKTNYVLAAHSHGGQVYLPLFNFLYRPLGAKKYFKGKYNKNNVCLDITNGVGMTNKKARLLADCEVVIYKLSGY